MNLGISVVVIGFVVSFFSLLLCEADGKMARGALSVVLVASLISPIKSALSDLSLELENTEGIEVGGFSEACAASFCEGIRLAVCEEFSLSYSDVIVSCEGFDAQSMTASMTTVVLCGKSSLSNHRGIREFVRENGSLECEVRMDFDG